MNRTASQREAAEQVLRGRAELPADAAAWGRTWKLTPAEATTLIQRERRRREQTG